MTHQIQIRRCCWWCIATVLAMGIAGCGEAGAAARSRDVTSMVDKSERLSAIALDSYVAIRVVMVEGGKDRLFPVAQEESSIINGIQRGMSQEGISMPIVGSHAQIPDGQRVLVLRVTKIEYGTGSVPLEGVVGFGVGGKRAAVFAEGSSLGHTEVIFRVSTSSRGGTAFQSNAGLIWNVLDASEKIGRFIAAASRAEKS